MIYDEKLENLEARLDAALCAMRVIIKDQQKTGQALGAAIQEIRDASNKQANLESCLNGASIAIFEIEAKQAEMARIVADTQGLHDRFKYVVAQVDTLSEKSTINKQSLRDEMAAIRGLVEDLRGKWLCKE